VYGTQVTGIGPKTFTQCAGFLRVFSSKSNASNTSSKKRSTSNWLDETSVHPESYDLAIAILECLDLREYSATKQPLENVQRFIDAFKSAIVAYCTPKIGTSKIWDSDSCISVTAARLLSEMPALAAFVPGSSKIASSSAASSSSEKKTTTDPKASQTAPSSNFAYSIQTVVESLLAYGIFFLFLPFSLG
jgi:hypothetical protein